MPVLIFVPGLILYWIQSKFLCRSHKKIPYELDENKKRVLQMEYRQRFSIVDDNCMLHPLECPLCGGESLVSTDLVDEATVILPTKTFKANSTVFRWLCVIVTLSAYFLVVNSMYCSHCKATIDFDGQSCCVLNMGKFLVSYEVLRNFLFQFVMGRLVKSQLFWTEFIFYFFVCHRTTIFTQYSVLMKLLNDSGSINLGLFSYHQYLQSWYAFLELLDINFSDGFLCNKCGSTPSIIIMDATSLAFRKSFLPPKILHNSTVIQSGASANAHAVKLVNNLMFSSSMCIYFDTI